MKAQQPRRSRLRSLLAGGACIALTGCALLNSEQPNVSAQPPADKQIGAVLILNEAQKLDHEQKFNEAAKLYAQLIAEYPTESYPYERLARIQLESNQFDDAAQTAQKYRNQFPDSPAPLLVQGAVFSQRDNLAEAETTYQRGSERFPDNEELLLGQCLVLGKLNRLDEAAQLLDRKLAESDHWTATMYALRAQIALMDQSEDITARTGSIQLALRLLTTAVEKSPERPEFWSHKAELERALNDYVAASQSLETLQRLVPDNEQVNRALISLYLQQDNYADVLIQIKRLVQSQNEQTTDLLGLAAHHALATDKPEEAITIAREGARLLPENMDAQFLLGYILVLSQHFDEAEAALSQTRSQLYTEQPNAFDPRLELYYGIALLHQQKAAEATEIFTELAAQQFEENLADYLQLLLYWDDNAALARLAAVLSDIGMEIPESAYIPYFQALIQQQQQAYPDALQSFVLAEKKAENLNAKKEQILNDTFYYLFASTYERCGQLEAAEKLFRQAIQLNPERADAMNYLAYIWAENNIHLEEAAELITKALELEPETGAFIDTLGWVRYQQGHYAQAMEALTQAAELIQNDPTIFDHLGDCALKLGKPQQAREYWLKSLSLQPDTAIRAKMDAIPAE